MSEEQETYNTEQQTRADKMWIAGWALAKYEEEGLLPETDDDMNDWFYGFTMGTVEAMLYDHITTHLERLLKNHSKTLKQIKNWKNSLPKNKSSDKTKK